LDRIRAASVFLFALSDYSLKSKPYRAELNYTKALGIPIIPVQVGHITNVRATPVSELQILDYRGGDASSAFALVAAIETASRRPHQLPDPLLQLPAIPYGYLLRLGAAIDTTELSPMDQAGIVARLRTAFREEEDESVKSDIAGILQSLRSKPYISVATANEARRILASTAPPATDGVGAHYSAEPAGISTSNIPHPWPQPPVAQSNGLAVAGIVLGLIGMGIWAFGAAGIVCAAIAKRRNQKVVGVALAISIIRTLIGIIVDSYAYSHGGATTFSVGEFS
jgi:hypothetical protein